MARIWRAIGRNRDLPQLEGGLLDVGGAAVGATYEHVLAMVPNLANLPGIPAGFTSAEPVGAMRIRLAYLIFEGAITGAATNNFTLTLYQKRGGALLVNTTSSTTVVAGTQAVTPASMNNIVLGARLVFSGGTGAAETVTVSSVTATTFTATFANGHSGAYTIVAAPLAAITFASGTNAAALTPISLAVLQQHTLMPGDIVTIARSVAGTGLANPAYTAVLDWDLA